VRPRPRIVLALVALAVTACGKSAGAPKEPEVATGTEPTSFQRSKLVAHYSTLDGATGFVIDRTADPIVVRLDGTATNEPLVWHGALHESIDYQSPDKKVWLRVRKETGDVMLFQGPKEHEGVRVTRDADAKTLH
jgi:hypothetical protein